jgi:hypothetical protein
VGLKSEKGETAIYRLEVRSRARQGGKSTASCPTIFLADQLSSAAHHHLIFGQIVAAASVVLSGIAAIRFGVANGDAVVDEPGYDVGSRREVTSDLT